MSGHKNKLTRFKPFATLCESGSVFCVRGGWNKDFFRELEEFTGGERNKKDD